MADTLLFRKGPLSGLASLDIINGAISITTDEPGIYIDHDNKRSRIGDFITVEKMSDLDQYKISTDSTKQYNAHALYYVIENDALARWDGTQFKLINDRTALLNSLSTLNTALTQLTGVVATQGNSITANATAISNETSRATAAEKALGKRIDDIIGGEDGDSVASLRAALNKEITDRTEADASILAKATTAQNEVDALEDVVETLSGTVTTNKGLLDTEIERAKAAEKVNADAVTAEKERAMGAEAGLESKITTAQTNLNTAITEEVTRATAAENKIATFTGDTVSGGALFAEITRATNREDAIAEIATEARTKANNNATEIAGLKTADTQLDNKITAEVNRATAAEGALGERITALATESAKHALKTEVEAVAGDVSALSGTVTQHGTDIAGINADLVELNTAIGDEATERASEIERVEKLISDETTNRQNAITKEVTDRNSAIESAVNTAKSALETQISGNAANITQLGKDLTAEVTRAKGAEEANAANISTNTTNIASNLEKINKEISDRAAAVSAEETRAKGVEAGLTQSITILRGDMEDAVEAEAEARVEGDADTLAAAKTYADGLLEAANAMRYIGEVSTKGNLPTTDVEAGDTYVIVDPTFTLVSGVTYKVGDLLVAKNDQTDNNVAYPAAGWSHVPTGYDASLDQELKVTAATNGAKAALSSVMGSQEKGSLTIVGNTSSNVKATLNGSTLTINMQWGEWNAKGEEI